MKSHTALSIVLALFLNSGVMAQAEVASTNVQAQTPTDAQQSPFGKTLTNFEKQEQDLMTQQNEVNEKWAQYIKEKEAYLKELEQAANHEITDKFTLKKQLVSMVDQFKSTDAMKQIWGDFSQYTQHVPKNITIHFDTVNQIIDLKSDDVDTKGRPILEFEMNKQTGHTVETKRLQDGTETHKREKDVDVNTLTFNIESKYKPVVPKAQGGQTTSVATNSVQDDQIQAITDEWNDLEKQRDLAFKIMYFFMVFMMGTFGLLYVFFKMTQSEEHQAAIQKQKMMREAKNQNQVDFSHIDDECNTINPYDSKLPTRVTNQFTSSSMPFTNLAEISYAKAQEFKQRSRSNSFNNGHLDTTINSNKENHQTYDSTNPYHQNQDDNQHHASYNQETEYQLLSNMYASQNGY